MSEILSYEKFVENLRAYLLDTLNLQEERIYFEAKDEEGMAPNGDRLFMECRVSSEGKEVCGYHLSGCKECQLQDQSAGLCHHQEDCNQQVCLEVELRCRWRICN